MKNFHVVDSSCFLPSIYISTTILLWWIILALWLWWAHPLQVPREAGGDHVIYLVTGSSQLLAHDLFGANKKERMIRTCLCKQLEKKDSSTEFGGMKL